MSVAQKIEAIHKLGDLKSKLDSFCELLRWSAQDKGESQSNPKIEKINSMVKIWFTTKKQQLEFILEFQKLSERELNCPITSNLPKYHLEESEKNQGSELLSKAIVDLESVKRLLNDSKTPKRAFNDYELVRDKIGGVISLLKIAEDQAQGCRQSLLKNLAELKKLANSKQKTIDKLKIHLQKIQSYDPKFDKIINSSTQTSKKIEDKQEIKKTKE